jgi:hypothetical protein
MQHRIITNEDGEVGRHVGRLKPKPVAIVSHRDRYIRTGSAGIVLFMPAAARPLTDGTTASLAQTQDAGKPYRANSPTDGFRWRSSDIFRWRLTAGDNLGGNRGRDEIRGAQR